MNEFYTLADGFRVPKIGFGTSMLNGYNGVRIIESALNMGYRLLDSAFNYENEGAVGTAIKNSSVPRDQITVVSKLPGRHHTYEKALVTVQESLMRLQLDYIDMYLIHWPNPKEGKFVEAWKALIDSQKNGLIRSIGVCNFLPEHIEKLEKETGILPVVNQIELHPFFNQQKQRDFDSSKNIISEGWSPLGRASAVLEDKTLNQIAQNHGKTIAQVILRWEIQLGILPLPKSSSLQRQEENLNIFDFDLSEKEMSAIAKLTKAKGRIANQDPSFYQEF